MDFIKSIDIKKNQKICIINMPVPYREELSSLPEGVYVTPRPVGKFDKVILFTNTKEELTGSWVRLMITLKDGGEFWIVYPDNKNKIFNEINSQLLVDIAKEKNANLGIKMALLDGWIGIKIMHNKLIDSLDTAQNPSPRIVVKVVGFVSGDHISVFRTIGDSKIIDKSMYTSHNSVNISGSNTFTTTTLISADTPERGVLKVVDRNASGLVISEQSYSYSSWLGSVFTLTGGNLTKTYDSDDTVYVPYIDQKVKGTSIEAKILYAGDRYIVTYIKEKGTPYMIKGQITSVGVTVTVI